MDRVSLRKTCYYSTCYNKLQLIRFISPFCTHVLTRLYPYVPWPNVCFVTRYGRTSPCIVSLYLCIALYGILYGLLLCGLHVQSYSMMYDHIVWRFLGFPSNLTVHNFIPCCYSKIDQCLHVTFIVTCKQMFLP